MGKPNVKIKHLVTIVVLWSHQLEHFWVALKKDGP